jgi:hypothetical protein
VNVGAGAVGVSIGALIGVISGIMSLLILYDAFPRITRPTWFERIFGRHRASGIRIAWKVAAIPMFWFGGHWLSGLLIKHLNWSELLPYYMVSLAVVYILIMIGPLIHLIIKVCGRMR